MKKNQNNNPQTEIETNKVICNSSEEVMKKGFEKAVEGYDVKIYNQPRKGFFAFLFKKKSK